jgi:hypothetical protein
MTQVLEIIFMPCLAGDVGEQMGAETLRGSIWGKLNPKEAC